MRGVVDDLRDDGSARLGIPPELRFNEREVPLSVHEDQIEKSTPDRQLACERTKTSEERLDVSDWDQRGVCEQHVLKCEFIERSLIEWNSTKRGRLAVSHEYRGHELSIFHIVTEPLPEAGFFHGKSSARLVVVGPINLPVGRLFVEEVITECRKRGATRVDVLAFEFEMGLFPAVLDEAKQKGIDLSPKTIPPEVFDKRAVERGQVRFQDVAFIEVTPRFDKKDPLTLAVELTDFSVYYSQGLADAIAADLKKGKSEVVCDAGALIKISKNKQGLITRDVLTKHWTDWVDYWAVDFNYESRREIIKVPKGAGVNTVQGHLPGQEPSQRELELPATDFEERWTGAYIFENEWQSFRTRQKRALDMTTAPHTYEAPGRYTIAVKVIDIFGNDTITLVPITVG